MFPRNIRIGSCRLNKAVRTYRRALEKDGKFCYQDALIPPMRKFAIESPFLEDIVKIGFDRYAKSDTPEPQYLQEYKKEMWQISDEYNKVLFEWYDEK